MPQAMQFSVSMDILPGAGPFTILAAGESGTALIAGDLTCLPLPGNMMPMSRMDPTMPRAMSLLPQPNYSIPGGIGVVNSSGTLPSGGHFVIDGENNSAVSFSGGIASIPFGYLDTRNAPLRLYVDGKLIASKDISYNVVTRPN